MAGDIVGVPTTLTGLSITSSPGSAQTNTALLPVLLLAGGSQLNLASNTSFLVASGATVTFQGAMLSMRTIAGDSSLASLGPTNADCMQVAFVLRASGMSLICRSGNTIFNFNSAGSGAAV